MTELRTEERQENVSYFQVLVLEQQPKFSVVSIFEFLCVPSVI